MTLTETAAFTKKAVVVGGLFLIIIAISWGAFSYYYNYIYLPSLPPVEEKPENFFGPLPKLEFPISDTKSSDFNYTLDTETGSLPENLPKILKVYPIAPLSADLLALDRARDVANSLDFKSEPEALSSTQYRFTDRYGGNLIINLDTGNFKYTHKESTQSSQIQANFQDDDKINSDFKSFLSGKQLLKEQLSQGRMSKPIFDKSAKPNSSNAFLSLWQDNVEDYPIITPAFTQGLIKTTLTRSSDSIYRYKTMDYTYWPIDLENGRTYQLLPIDEAFSLLKTGEGAVLIKPQSAKVSITKVYIGYYLSEEYFPYLQPVYVFEGPQYAGVISAVHPDLITQ